MTEVRENEFDAVLRDRTEPANPDEQVTFARDEIAPQDAPLLKPGGTFYWIIGNENTAAGQQRNISILQFRRLPPWTDSRIHRLAKAAEDIKASLQE